MNFNLAYIEGGGEVTLKQVFDDSKIYDKEFNAFRLVRNASASAVFAIISDSNTK